MKVAFPLFSLGQSGGTKVIVRLANYLEGRGHDVTLLVPRRNRNSHVHTNARIVELNPLLMPDRPALSRFRTLPVAFPMAGLLRDYDVVVANYSPTVLPTKMSGNVRTTYYYLVQHDETIFFPPFSIEYWIARLSYGAMKTSRFFAVSHWLMDMIRERTGCDSTLLPPGIDHDTFYPRKVVERDDREVLVLARHEWWRGIQTFSDAMDIVKKELPDVHIRAVGKPIRTLRTKCRVTYGMPSDDELAGLYSSCGAFVLPSVLEGLPVPPLEAMACGSPVVLTDCLGTRDYAVNNGNCMMVSPCDVSGMAEAIIRALSDHELASRLRASGVECARIWTYERMCEIFSSELERNAQH